MMKSYHEVMLNRVLDSKEIKLHWTTCKPIIPSPNKKVPGTSLMSEA
jgi:hypothetical protein